MNATDSILSRGSSRHHPILELGRGGMATVYLVAIAGPGGFKKLQVVKQLREELASDPEFLTMFLDEARLAARINHPNVVQTNEVGNDGKNYFIAMEYLDGQSLEAVFRRAGSDGGMPLGLAIRVLMDTLDGLHYAHELQDFQGQPLNVVHRDISPHNIFVTYGGITKVVDFGIAKAADSSGETRTGVIKGKVSYMAPEQLRSKAKVDRRADVFAVGVILWRILAKKRLWKGLSDLEVFQHLLAGDIPPPTIFEPDAPKGLVDICVKALAVDLDVRYATAAEMQQALEEYATSAGLATSTRELGKYVSARFSEEREQVKAAIEQQLAKVGNEERSMSSSFEVLDMKQVVPSAMAESTADMMGLSNAAMDAPSTTAAHNAQVTGNHSARATFAPVAPSLRLSPPVSAPQGSGGAPLMAMLFGAAVLVFVGTYLASRATAPAPAPIASASPNTPAKEPEMIDLVIDVTPPAARVFIDEELVTSHPPHARKPRDGARHWIHADAPGYLLKAELVDFDAPALTVRLVLDRAPQK